ncbi:MAG: hypothetical protein K1X83_00085 [Oligoflexia bacterium]|nr:hypothetical protein [Oligoflexia bacterium]
MRRNSSLAVSKTAITEAADFKLPDLTLILGGGADDTLPSTAEREASHPHQHFLLHGHSYASRSEAACGELLRRYIPNFEIIDGKTQQIAIGRSERGHMRMVDFQIDNVLIEFHPPRFWRQTNKYGDFRDAKEYFAYRRTLKALRSPAARRSFKARTVQMLSARYTAKRRAQIDQCPEHRGKELIVVHNAEQFYELVLKRWGRPTLPSCLEISEEFKQLLGTARACSVDRTQQPHSRTWHKAA